MAEEIILKITGKVQGIFFRVNTKKIADQLNIKGYVKNEPDGSIKIVAQGQTQALDKLADWCKTGPKLAKIEKVKKKVQPIKKTYDDFLIIY